MKYVFAAIGGSGSNYLIRVLGTRYEIDAKPDTVFRPYDEHLSPYERSIDQGTFEGRAHGYHVDEEASLEAILPDYLAHLRSSPRRTAVFNTAAELGLFSKLRSQDVVFLVRHPLHAYVSWAKPGRHADIVNQLGGLEAEESIAYYARRWSAFVRELNSLRAASLLGGCIRYERAQLDAMPLGLDWIFAEFDSSRRNADVLSATAERYLEERVTEMYETIYTDWRLG